MTKRLPSAEDLSDTPRRRLRAIVLFWGPLLLYAGLIFYLSSLSRPQDLFPVRIWDKTAHVLEYAILGILCYRVRLQASTMGRSSSAVRVAIVAATLYGVTDELHQSFVPLREADMFDLCADSIGATFGALMWKQIWGPSRQD